MLKNASGLNSNQSRLENLGLESIVDQLQEALVDLIEECASVSTLNSSDVSDDVRARCEDLVANNDSYVPVIQVDFTSMGGTTSAGQLWIAKIVELLESEVFKSSAEPSAALFNGYLAELVSKESVVSMEDVCHLGG